MRTTAANGMLSFTGLDHGTYVLTESKEPAGYEAVGDTSTTFVVETDDTGATLMCTAVYLHFRRKRN